MPMPRSRLVKWHGLCGIAVSGPEWEIPNIEHQQRKPQSQIDNRKPIPADWDAQPREFWQPSNSAESGRRLKPAAPRFPHASRRMARNCAGKCALGCKGGELQAEQSSHRRPKCLPIDFVRAKHRRGNAWYLGQITTPASRHAIRAPNGVVSRRLVPGALSGGQNHSADAFSLRHLGQTQRRAGIRSPESLIVTSRDSSIGRKSTRQNR